MDHKNIPNPGFADDDGTADPRLAQALAAWSKDRAAEPELLAALTPSRLMVPIVALLGEVETDATGLKHEKTSDMAVPVIEAPDGRRALPAFTSLETLARWRADARPAPVAAPQAVLAAYSERADTLLIDPAGPVTYQLTGARMRAVAENRTYLPPAQDPAVHEAVGVLLAAEPDVLRAEFRPSAETDGILALSLADGLSEDAVRQLSQRLAAALAADPVLRVRLTNGLDLALLKSQG
ncbi:SseB family protein [Kitasatospora atroaurantiaca]|uniref:SseB family protein n=1 Tax=Kitasatospora atroaurantiaca TaxID=285545 RepID=UPI0011AA8B28|nr:SseB family protein [Kitasatospora atroaurantiaca]